MASRLVRLILTDQKIDVKKYDTFVNEKVRLNFYGDFLIPFTKESILEAYLMEQADGEHCEHCEELVEGRKQIWQTFSGIPMYAQALSPARFIHF